MVKKRLPHLLFLLILFLLGSLLGGLFGNWLGIKGDEEYYRYAKRLKRGLELIESSYMEEVEREALLKNAIAGILTTLDPHSYYVTAEDYRQLSEGYRGKYTGIGVSFDLINGVITVISTVEGGPSYKVDIRAGDQIVEVEGSSVIGISRERVPILLRGPKGSRVRVTIRRVGVDLPLHFTIVRDVIPIESIPYAFIIPPDVGYLRIIRFAQTTSQELQQRLEELKELGMRRILLDLRSNTGGFLIQAVKVAGAFLPPRKKIVTTRGRASRQVETFISRENTPWKDYPLVVLINLGSASASEIVAGAVQDWDRGLIVGETSFGKGLAQTQHELVDGSVLFLTTARYHTPSGRIIQRPYEDLRSYIEEGLFPSSTTQPEDRELFYTAGGRKVYGGGGITPDEIIPAEPLPQIMADFRAQNLFFSFANLHSPSLLHLKEDYDRFLEDFEIDEQLISQFIQFLQEQKMGYSPEEFQRQLPLVKLWLKSEIASLLWDREKGYQVLVTNDPQVERAVQLFPQTTSLLPTDNNKKAPAIK